MKIPKKIIWKLIYSLWFPKSNNQQLQNPSFESVTNKDLCLTESQILSQDTLTGQSKGYTGVSILLSCSSSIMKGQGEVEDEKDKDNFLPPTRKGFSSMKDEERNLFNLIIGSQLLSTIPKQSLKTKRFFTIDLKIKPDLSWQKTVSVHFFNST